MTTPALPPLSLKGGPWCPSPQEWEKLRLSFPTLDHEATYMELWSWHETKASPSKRKKNGLAFVTTNFARAYTKQRSRDTHAHVRALRGLYGDDAKFLSNSDGNNLLASYGALTVMAACVQCVKHQEQITGETIADKLNGQKFSLRKDIPPTPKLAKPESADVSLSLINDASNGLSMFAMA